ncbi:MAG: hypothetical protein WC627_02185 [Legionella sp.]
MTLLTNVMNNPVMRYLSKIQAYLDDQDIQLKQSPITRSPYHIIAFLISWKLIDNQAKPFVITQLQNILQATPISVNPILTKENVDTFINTINWPDLLAELKYLHPKFIELELPPEVFAAVQNHKDSFYSSLKSHQLITQGQPKIYKIKTTLNQDGSWKTPFKERYCPITKKVTWMVEDDTFTLSDSLISLIKQQANAQKTPGEIQTELGVFTITTSVNLRKTAISGSGTFCYELFIENQEKKQLQLEYKNKIDLGLYQAFIGCNFRIGSFLSDAIDNVSVEYNANSKIDRIGSQVRQQQEVRLDEGCSGPSNELFQHEVRDVTATILVNSIFALYKTVQIGVHFDVVKHQLAQQNKDISIALHTVNIPNEVILYPLPLTHSYIFKNMQSNIITVANNPHTLYQPARPPTDNNAQTANTVCTYQ